MDMKVQGSRSGKALGIGELQSIARAFEFCVLRMRICMSTITDCVNSNSRAREVRNVLRARKKGGLLSRHAIQNGLAASCYGISF